MSKNTERISFYSLTLCCGRAVFSSNRKVPDALEIRHAHLGQGEDKTDGKSKARKPNSQGFSGLGRPARNVLGLAWPPPSLTPRQAGKGVRRTVPGKGLPNCLSALTQSFHFPLAENIFLDNSQIWDKGDRISFGTQAD